MRKNFFSLLLLILCAGLAGCAPPAVPDGATVHWDKEWGSYWTWARWSEHGCIEWTATNNWALANLQIGPRYRCGTTGEGMPPVRGAGIDYASSWDEIVFTGWWPQDWPQGAQDGSPC